MTLHFQSAVFLDRLRSVQESEISIADVQKIRRESNIELDLPGPIEPGVTIYHRFVTSPTADLPLRIYVPDESDGPFRGMVYFHGGGWFAFNIAMYDAQLTSLAKKTNSIIVSVNYQKTPEHKFPIPFDDSFSALEWLFSNAEEWNIDKDKIGVAGDSAGGNLAAAVALKTRDTYGSVLAYQLLIYPCNGVDFNTESMQAYSKGYGTTRAGIRWIWDQYLNSDEDLINPYAVPHSSKDFSGLPPTVLITAEFDVLRDDGRAYAEKLKNAGVTVSYRDFSGMIHGFFNYGKYIDEGIGVRDYLAGEINQILDPMV
jgi:acetyl esterase